MNTRAARTDQDLLRLLALREIEVSGPLAGLDVINHVAATARLLDITPPGYTLLHDLAEARFLEFVEAKPRRYRITEAGSREAERLAEQFWPRLHEEVVSLTRRLAPATPRAVPPTTYESEWFERPMLHAPTKGL